MFILIDLSNYRTLKNLPQIEAVVCHPHEDFHDTVDNMTCLE